MPRVAVAGAGVSGLTCGVVLAESGYDATVFFSPLHAAASPVAAAIWYPYHIGDEATPWADESYAEFETLARDPRTGVSMVHFDVHGMEPPPDRVPFIETPIYLPWLRDRLRGRIHPRTIEDLHELEREFDLVVNCTGLGARDLCNDPLVEPSRGVVLNMRNPGFTRHTVTLDSNTLTYILTRTHDIVLGGTDDVNPSIDVPPSLAQDIYDRCARVEPRLPTNYEVDVGFRPLRPHVRLEHEPGTRIIHNYGHGGAGFTVSWGCAREVLRLCQSASKPG